MDEFRELPQDAVKALSKSQVVLETLPSQIRDRILDQSAESDLSGGILNIRFLLVCVVLLLLIASLCYAMSLTGRL